MRKINLKLDALAVESFLTAAAPVGTGTVEAHQVSGKPACFPTRYCPTEYISCEGGCTGGTIIC
jgi:hypothetical protein